MYNTETKYRGVQLLALSANNSIWKLIIYAQET